MECMTFIPCIILHMLQNIKTLLNFLQFKLIEKSDCWFSNGERGKLDLGRYDNATPKMIHENIK